MTTIEHESGTTLDLGKIWFFGAVALSLFFVATTLLRPFNPGLLSFFDLDREGNIATLWSGMLMLLVGLHALDGWFRYRANHSGANPALARAWLILAAIMIGLSFDEVSEVHERMPSVGGMNPWWSLLPFAIVMLGMLSYVLRTLYRTPGQRHTFWLVFIAFLLIATVPIQVRIEASHEWPGYLQRLRTAVEEAVELLAMLLLLKAALPNTKGLFSSHGGLSCLTDFPVFEAIVRYRYAILLAGLVGAVVFAIISPHLTSSHANKQGGEPTAWLAASLYILGTLAVLRSSLKTGGQPHWSSVALALLAGLACATAMLSVTSTLTLTVLAVVVLLSALLWHLNPQLHLSGFLPAAVSIVIVLLVAWSVRGNLTLSYLIDPLLALGFFYGCTSGHDGAPAPNRG